MKFSIAIVSFAATVAVAVAEDCTETSEAGCNALDACTWCNCSAIPSECWTIAAASKLPSGVYACDKKMVATEERPRSHGRTARLGKHVHFAPPRSRVVEGILGGNGSSIPAGGDVWPTAIYYTTVQIGTPPQDFPVAIDSGSGDLDVSGKGCVGCVTIPPNREYDHASSKTSHPRLPFQFSNSYQTCDLKDPTAVCTITGKLYTDEVSLAGFGPVSMGLGSITKQTSNFDQFKVIDGVMGFTQGGKEDVFAQLVAAGKCDNVWSICMHEGSVSNGTLTIGGVDPRLSDKVDYVKDVGQGFHSVHVESITIGGSSVTASSPASPADVGSVVQVGKAAILDTGTNILLVPATLLKPLQAAMCADSSLASCSDLWADKCLPLTDAQLAAYPPMSLDLDNGVKLAMTAKDYLLLGSPLAGNAGNYCLGIKDGGDAGGGFIIGDTTMRNYYLVFDLAGGKIGWGPVNTATCGSI